MSKKQLATAMGFDPSYVSHVEARRHRPTEDFARRAEAILQTGGTLWERFKQYDDLRINARMGGRAAVRGERAGGTGELWLPPGVGLVVDHEVATLSFRDGRYRCSVRRVLYNAGTEPVTRFPVRIAVDRYPGDPERSNRHYRAHPLTWEELALTAACAGELMRWQARTDRDAYKEAWLLFENAHGRFPLYPGQRTTISYSYQVPADKWGPYFQRAMRLPTRRLSVEVDFPAALRPVVWGVETSLSTEAVPLRTPITSERSPGGRVIFSWQTDNPTLHAWYRLEWRFRGVPEDTAPAADPVPAMDPAPLLEPAPGPAAGPWPVAGRGHDGDRAPEVDRMRSAGIVQRGAHVLRVPARRFDLPGEAGIAADVVAQLAQTLDRIEDLHPFAKGVGLAAPQIGLGWAAAVVRTAGVRATTFALLNPRIIGESAERDEQYEGCLSFFDVRGVVVRPTRITVERFLPSGERAVDVYERAVARLVAHEIDHLEGRLYVDRIGTDGRLVPLEEYGDAGRPWCY